MQSIDCNLVRECSNAPSRMAVLVRIYRFQDLGKYTLDKQIGVVSVCLKSELPRERIGNPKLTFGQENKIYLTLYTVEVEIGVSPNTQ